MIAAVIFFSLTQVEIYLPSYTKAREVRDAISRLSEPGTPLVVVQGLVPPMSAYFPDRHITRIHWLEVQNPEIVDSLDEWAQDHVLVLSHDVPHTLQADAVVEDIDIIAP